MASRRRHLHRRRSFNGGKPIAIRVGSRRSPRRFHEIQVNGPKDAGRFARFVDEQVHTYPRDPLIIAVNGYQPWLEEVFNSCIRDSWSEVSDLDREVQFANSMQFPEKASQTGDFVPWTFIIDNMNVPQVYYWSVDLEPPSLDDYGLPYIQNFRFRLGVWQMGQGACTFDPNVPVTIIFTRPTDVCEHVVTELLFPFLYKDQDFAKRRNSDEEQITWIFLRLYWLLTDWQNIVFAIKARLKEADDNSHGRKLPVKMRARTMHHEVDRIYELKEYLQFHQSSLTKLQKLKSDAPEQAQADPLWTDVDDAVEDLNQYSSTIDGLKERFNNLLDLEFNIQNAVQSDNSQFLSIIATIFLPISYLSGLWGFSSVTWKALWYVYAVVPVLILSVLFTLLFRRTVLKVQKWLYPMEQYHVHLHSRDFTLLGAELPNSTDPSGSFGATKVNRKRSHSQKENTPRYRPRSKSMDEKGN